jgi:hypothetical protein
MTIPINASSNFHLQPLDLLDVPAGSEASGDGSDAGSDQQLAPEFLTDASMLAYCGSQLQGIDSQIQKMFSDQQKQNQEQQIINQALQVLQGCTDGTLDSSGASAPNHDQCVAMEKALESAIDQIAAIDPNAACLTDLKHIHDNLMATGTGDKDPDVGHGYYFAKPTDANPTPDSNIKSSEMAQFIQAVQTVGSGLNNDAQLRMIQIQSLVSQQQTAVELTTNIMQSLDDSMKKVVENIHS